MSHMSILGSFANRLRRLLLGLVLSAAAGSESSLPMVGLRTTPWGDTLWPTIHRGPSSLQGHVRLAAGVAGAIGDRGETEPVTAALCCRAHGLVVDRRQVVRSWRACWPAAAHLSFSTQFFSWLRWGLLQRLLAASWHMVVPPHLLMWCKLTVRPLALCTWPRYSLQHK